MTKDLNKAELPTSHLSAILTSLSVVIERGALKQLAVVLPALLVMSGRVTMLGISRWSEKGGSYRSIQRFFNRKLLWQEIQWCLIRDHLLDADDVYLLAGDEVVVTKSGKKSYGLDRFFSSLYGKPIKSLCFFSLSLISVKQRVSYPLIAKQVIRSQQADEAKTELSQKQEAKKQRVEKSTKSPKKRGRPKGTKNKDKLKVELSAYLCFVKTLLEQVLGLIRPLLKLDYLVLDGAYGNNEATQLAQQLGLSIITKLKCNSALYFPYEGKQKARGAKRIYGDKLDYPNLPTKYRQSSCISKGIQTDSYQMTLRHKTFSMPLNVVIIVKTKLKTKLRSHVVLFSTDLDLSYDHLIDYYSLRFQIEFNFRDAKQFWGLEDFMSINQLPIHNAANLSLFMVNLSKSLIKAQHHQVNPDFSVLDLKAHSRAFRYAAEALKLLPFKPTPFLIHQFFHDFPKLGAIRRL